MNNSREKNFSTKMDIIAEDKNSNDRLVSLLGCVVYKGKTFFNCNFFTFNNNNFLANTKAMVEIVKNFSQEQIYQLLKPVSPTSGTLLHRMAWGRGTYSKEKLLLITGLVQLLPKGK